MPGNFVHVPSAPNFIRNSELGFKGLIAPDLWKKSIPTREECLQFFQDDPGAPTYEQVQFLASETHGGTHFGSMASDTNHADFNFIRTLFECKMLDKNNPFFIGFVHHLRVDSDFYADSKICNILAFSKDAESNKEDAMQSLHADWDKTNRMIGEWYPEVLEMIDRFPEKARKVIKFIDGTPRYIELERMHEFIERMRQLRTIDEMLT